jgi:hypothetical protein
MRFPDQNGLTIQFLYWQFNGPKTGRTKWRPLKTGLIVPVSAWPVIQMTGTIQFSAFQILESLVFRSLLYIIFGSCPSGVIRVTKVQRFYENKYFSLRNIENKISV